MIIIELWPFLKAPKPGGHYLPVLPIIDLISKSFDTAPCTSGPFSLTNLQVSLGGVNVLNNICLEFDAGKTTAIVGALGSGKSSIVHLIQRFYKINEGEILIDDQKIINLDIENCQ